MADAAKTAFATSVSGGGVLLLLLWVRKEGKEREGGAGEGKRGYKGKGGKGHTLHCRICHRGTLFLGGD